MSAEAAAFADRLPQAHDGPSSSVAMVDHVDPSLSAKMENGSLEEPESGVWLSGVSYMKVNTS